MWETETESTSESFVLHNQASSQLFKKNNYKAKITNKESSIFAFLNKHLKWQFMGYSFSLWMPQSQVNKANLKTQNLELGWEFKMGLKQSTVKTNSGARVFLTDDFSNTFLYNWCQYLLLHWVLITSYFEYKRTDRQQSMGAASISANWPECSVRSISGRDAFMSVLRWLWL